MKQRVADFVANFVHELGVEHVFLVTGAGIMNLTDGIACHPKLQAIPTHHELSAAQALECYARASDHLGVGYFTTGPGTTNAISGVAGAWQDSVPCLFISGQVKKVEASHLAGITGLRQFGVQELDIIPIVTSLTKYAKLIESPDSIKFELEKAVHMATSGRPGPVWIDIPMDIQGATIATDTLSGFTPDIGTTASPKTAETQQFCQMLSKAKRPVIIAGRGVRLAKALQPFRTFIEKHNIPVVTPFLGVDNLEWEHPNCIGKPGVKGDRAANFAMQNSDLIIALGTSLHVSVIGYTYSHFARAAKKVVVDIDMTSHQKSTIAFDLMIPSDLTAFFDNVDTASTEDVTTFPAWLKTCQDWKSQYPVCLEEYSHQESPINLYSFIEELSTAATEDSIFISDAGSNYYAACQGIKLKPNQRFIISGAMGSMGYTLPAAIGASTACPGHTVLAITGDGSFQQSLQELSVLKSHDMNIKLFVIDNDGYLSIRNSQKKFFQERYIGESDSTGVVMPDIAKICEAYSIPLQSVESLADLKSNLGAWLTQKGPCVFNVRCQPDQQIIPTVASKVNPDGSMSSRPLEDMYPFLPDDERDANILIPQV